MSIERVKEIANAVLYEGYLLYPYRHSAIKNRSRWTFGVVYPREHSEASGGLEPWTMQTECLLTGSAATSLAIHMRCLHLLVRRMEQAASSPPAQGAESELDPMRLAHRLASETSEEGVEREISVSDFALGDLLAHPRSLSIEFPGGRTVEESASDHDQAVRIVREQQPVSGSVVIAAERLRDLADQPDTALFKLSIRIENTTPYDAMIASQHNVALLQSFVATHTIMQVQQGAFVSLLDPPADLKADAERCSNVRTWPVLVGEEGETDWMLSSPIILYDYPQIAPESPGDLFDGTEIDELLTLRIMTLTDEEKQEMRQADERARQILDRTEALTSEQFMQLHGTIRSLRPLDQGAEK
ncbi:MAG: hypothetical protein IMW89_06260 [Ktedonobacteraceae bacterium]|nr:hypothetical protein [Ktedonobacteraceae bacterium]